MMGGARFICKPVALISRPGVRHCKVPSQKKGNVVIPPRIERGPTDILKALASTVGRDHTAFHYKYPDDPYFYPNSENMKKVLALSLESGKKSAKWVFNNNLEFFKNQLSEPVIEEFSVKSAVSSESKPTEETLLSAIEKRNVLKAIEVYEALQKEKHNVSQSTKQCLLELTCFYNCQERERKSLEEKWFNKDLLEKKNINIWMHQGFAEKLFESMDSTCSLANSAIIQGMLKYDEIALARKIFEEAKMKKVKLSVGVYNMFLSKIIDETNLKNVTSPIQNILTEMSEERVRPNVGTLNAILQLLILSQDYSKINFALEVMHEFEKLGIEPSLGTYGYLLLILSYSRTQRNAYYSIINEIMTHIEGKKFEILHPSDFKFFENASTALAYYHGNSDLSLRLFNMYFRNNNSKFVKNFFLERSLFKDLLPVIFKDKPIDVIMDVYRRCFFKTYDPVSKISRQLISAIGKNHASQYLIEVWEDLQGMNSHKNLSSLTNILNVVDDFSDEASLKVFHSAAVTYLSVTSPGRLDFAITDPNVLSNILIAFVKNEDEPRALKLLEILKKRGEINLNQRSIELLFNYALSKQKIPIILEALRIAADTGFLKVAKMARKALPLLEGDSKKWVTELINKEKKEDESNDSKE